MIHGSITILASITFTVLAKDFTVFKEVTRPFSKLYTLLGLSSIKRIYCLILKSEYQLIKPYKIKARVTVYYLLLGNWLPWYLRDRYKLVCGCLANNVAADCNHNDQQRIHINC